MQTTIDDLSARPLEVVVLSDLHLGTYGAQAKELYTYLKSISPKMLILNGDIIDIWQFKKNYFPKSHLKVLKRIVSLASTGTKVVYITGNHDEMLRQFAPFNLGDFELCNKKILDIDGKKTWIFHGDVFDHSVHHSKWIARLGGHGYDFLIRVNALTNWILAKFGREKYSFSKKIKASVKKAVKFIGDFEKIASELAIENGFDQVICGHIHQPVIKTFMNEKGSVLYLNSGDWIENLTALEYNNGKWELYAFNNADFKTEANPEVETWVHMSALSHLIADVTKPL